MDKLKKFWSFKAKNETEGELLIYGPISDMTWWGDEVTPLKFKKELDDLGDISTLNIFINSDGGDVFAGQAIYSILKRHKAQKIVYVDGLAASIASLIAMAGDLVIMPANAMMMIHNPWTIMVGNAAQFRKIADDMDKIRESMIAAYKEKSGLEQEKIIEIMDAETLLTADAAVKYGFADEIEETKKLAASFDGSFLTINGQKFDLSRYKNLPEIKTVIMKAGVVPDDVSKEKAPESEPWEAPTLSDFTDESWSDLSDAEKRRIAGHFAWAKEMPPETYGNLKLGHHRPSDGKVVWRGVANAAARLDQTDIPEEDKAKVRSHLGSHYRQFEKEIPWENSQKIVIKNEGRTLSAANEQRIRQARDLLDETLNQLENQENKIDKTPLSQQQDLLFLYQCQVQLNKNKIRRKNINV